MNYAIQFDFVAAYRNQIRHLLDWERIDHVLIGRLTPEQARAIGAAGREVWLSSYTAHKIASKQTYDGSYVRFRVPLLELLPRIIATGECRQDAPRKLVFLWSNRLDLTKPYRAAVKATADGQHIFLDSAYRITLAQIAVTVRNSKPVASK